ncbi:hypothetical protein JTB14_002129 [Gonioctena quinquepunctata]|nr:hypothetical protein JTB14_002129 [Gonioctena quinquepunctata]
MLRHYSPEKRAVFVIFFRENMIYWRNFRRKLKVILLNCEERQQRGWENFRLGYRQFCELRREAGGSIRGVLVPFEESFVVEVARRKQLREERMVSKDVRRDNRRKERRLQTESWGKV